ncbi:MAG: O-antigen ligase family protein [Desulfurispora sp.]|uniref:O-antigen ligase family protein n=1 Tax=Desulfurispora sp. TaxID=3014275 RepID=UPI004049ADD5
MIFQHSLLGQLGRGLRAAAPHSRLLTFLTVPAAYTDLAVLSYSRLIALLYLLSRQPARCLAALGGGLRRAWTHSRLVGLKAPPWLAGSLLWQQTTALRVESLLWPAALYPGVDFALRQFMPALAAAWDELLLLTIIAMWPLQMALRGRLKWRPSRLDIPMLVYFALLLFLYFLRSPDANLAREGLRVYLEYPLWFFAGYQLLQNRRQFTALLGGLLGLAGLVAAYGIAQYLLGVEMPASWVDQAEAGVRLRIFSIFTSPNVLGCYLMIFIPVALALLFTTRGRAGRAGLALLLMVLLTAEALTFSRGAWLALLLALLVFSLLYRPWLLAALAAGALAVPKLVPAVGARISYMLSSAYIASSNRAGRLARWQNALELWQREPWLGLGYGRFGGAVAARRIPGAYYVDNFYLKTAVETGLVGLLALLWLLLSLLRALLDSWRRLADPRLKLLAAGLLAGLCGVVAQNLVENIFEAPVMATQFWLLAGLSAALPHVERE